MRPQHAIKYAGIVIAALCLTLTACQTTSKDIERWATTQQGPRKLTAVLKHAKYPRALRVEAAMTLIGMRPRGGRRVGVEQALSALAELAPSERSKLMAALVPSLIGRLGAPAAAAGAEDTSLPFKDASVAILTETDVALLDSQEQNDALSVALTQWAMTDFVGRMEASGQKIDMQQMLRFLGPSSVKELPALIVPGAPKVNRIAQFVAEIGDAETKLRASQKLVEVAQFTSSPKWRETHRETLSRANAESGMKPDPKAFDAQLDRFQEEELLRLFASMRRVGGKTSVEYLLEFAGGARPEKQRSGALAALERQIESESAAQIGALVRIASADDTPDSVRGLALRRMGELPREKVAAPLLALFGHDNWKVRWLAAELLLKMSQTQHLAEFMDQLRHVEHMSLTEPLSYGALIGELKGPEKPEELADSYSSISNKVPVRLAALGYYYSHGGPDQVAKVERFSSDPRKLPRCAENARDCEWRCADREVETVGKYVEHCILPAMRNRKGGPTQNAVAKPSQDPQKTQ
jgi:Tfp pilus assembly protein PilP